MNMKEVKIVRANLDNAKDIAKVEISSGYLYDGSFDAIRNSLNLLKDENEYVFVAKEKDNIIGYISLRKNRGVGELGFLAVIKKYQNKSVATNLIKFILKYALKIKCKKLILSVRNTNFKAVLLYKKFGFYVTKTEKKRIKNKEYLKLTMGRML